MGAIRELQNKLLLWSKKSELKANPILMTLGVVEEVGELSHALLKREQGIRGFDDNEKFEAAAKDAIGDSFIYLTQVASELGYDLEDIINETAAGVLKRDWVANPVDADKKVQPHADDQIKIP